MLASLFGLILSFLVIIFEFLPEFYAFFHEVASSVCVLLLGYVQVVVQRILHMVEQLFVVGAVLFQHFLGHQVNHVKSGVYLLFCEFQSFLGLLTRH